MLKELREEIEREFILIEEESPVTEEMWDYLLKIKRYNNDGQLKTI